MNIPAPPLKVKHPSVAISLNQFCDGFLIKAEIQAAQVTRCVEALRMVIGVLQQSDRPRDGAVARIILSIAQGQTSVEDGRRELRTALLNG